MIQMSLTEISALEQNAANIRKTIIKAADFCHGKVHWGSSLSCVEILTVLYKKTMNIVPFAESESDQLIISKGHAALALYATMCETGIISEDFLMHYQEDGGLFPEEITMTEQLQIPCSTGSLGLGLPYATGIALRKKREGKNGRVFVIVGDGECDEGSMWEAFLFAKQYRLDNLELVIDYNHLQSDGKVEDILTLKDLSEKLQSMGWYTQQINGHDVAQLYDAWLQPHNDQPGVVIAETIKGNGISFMENNGSWHDRILNKDCLEIARREVGL